MPRKLLVARFDVPGYTDGADYLAAIVPDQHAAALGKNAAIRRFHQIAHEERSFLRARPHQARRAPQRQRGIRLAHRHFEPHHRGPVFFLERYGMSADIGEHNGEGTAIELTSAREDGIDDALR